MPEPAPPLVLLAHGTRDPAGLATLEGVRSDVADRCAGTPTLLALLGPGPEARLAHGVLPRQPGPVVVVPFLLADGVHVALDVPRLVAGRTDVVTPALGFGPEVVRALADRVRSASGRPGAVVLAAAGSSRARSRAQARLAAVELGRLLGAGTATGFLSGPGPGVAEAAADARRGSPHGPLVLASALLAPGTFQDRLVQAADGLGAVATAPLARHPLVVGVVVDRYRRARAGVPAAHAVR